MATTEQSVPNRRIGTFGRGCRVGPGDFHPEPLTDPDLTLSRHPARATARRLPPFLENWSSSCCQLGSLPTSVTCPLRSTGITPASSLLRSSPPLAGASVLSASRLEPLVPSPLTSPVRFSRSIRKPRQPSGFRFRSRREIRSYGWLWQDNRSETGGCHATADRDGLQARRLEQSERSTRRAATADHVQAGRHARACERTGGWPRLRLAQTVAGGGGQSRSRAAGRCAAWSASEFPDNCCRDDMREAVGAAAISHGASARCRRSHARAIRTERWRAFLRGRPQAIASATGDRSRSCLRRQGEHARSQAGHPMTHRTISSTR